MLYNTIDSQPQESLNNNADLLHTLCVCSFESKSKLFEWIDKIIPHDINGKPIKWSSGSGRKRSQKHRYTFIENVNKYKDEIDFKVFCISSTESQISSFANVFYLKNIQNIKQEFDQKGRNCLVFKITEEKSIKMPVLRAANILWIYYCLKYLSEEKGLDGFFYSDWFCNDSLEGEDKALGVSLLNYFLSSSKIEIKVSIANYGLIRYDDIISDWFAGWSNSSRNGIADEYLKNCFDKLLDEKPNIIEWINFQCEYTIAIKDKKDA